jgi:cytochrome d ubiquinol oxidase subunit I
VFGLMTTASAVSPGVSTGEVLTSLIVLTLLYGVLALIEVRLMLTYIRQGADHVEPPPTDHAGADEPLAFAY